MSPRIRPETLKEPRVALVVIAVGGDVTEKELADAVQFVKASTSPFQSHVIDHPYMVEFVARHITGRAERDALAAVDATGGGDPYADTSELVDAGEGLSALLRGYRARVRRARSGPASAEDEMRETFLRHVRGEL